MTSFSRSRQRPRRKPGHFREIAFGEWLPDLPEAAEATSSVENLIPTAVDPFRPEVIYGPIPSPTRLSLPHLEEKPTAMLGFLDNQARHVNVVGTDTDLKRMNLRATAWTSVKPSSVTYTGVAPWDFTRFGDNIIGARREFTPVILKPGADGFVSLGGDPPKAGIIAAVGEFAVLADIKDAEDNLHPSRVQWSGFDNVESWGDLTRQSDHQDLFSGGGRVRRIVPGDHGWIFQESAITRMQYVGPPFFFRFDVVRPNLGTRAPKSVVWHGSDIFFYGNNGFYRMNRDSGSVRPIGAGRVDQYFLDNVQTNGFESLQGAVDYRRQLVWWSYPKGAGTTHFEEALIYHYGIDKWSRIVFAHGADRGAILMGGFQMPDIPLDALDGTQWFPTSTGIDTPGSPSLDDPRFFGALEFVVFTQDDATGNYYTNILTGDAYTGRICTSRAHNHGDILFVSSARPLMDGTPDVRVRWRARNEDDSAEVLSAWQSPNKVGEATQRVFGRYLCAEVEFRGSFSRARGVAANFRRAGTR